MDKINFLNGVSLYFELFFPTNKFLQDDFIKSFCWYNVSKECSIKRSFFSINSKFNRCTNDHKISIPIRSFLWSMPVSIELSYLHYCDLSLWSLALTFHAQTSLLIFSIQFHQQIIGRIYYFMYD